MKPRKLLIGTRKKRLARIQAEILFTSLVSKFPELREVTHIKPYITTGDQHPNQRLADIGGKGLFTQKLDQALLNDEIDLAIHSLKDMETILPKGIEIACVLERGDPRDVFISKTGLALKDMPQGSIIGTASIRRQSLLLNMRPDMEVKLIRGSVETRLQKIADGLYDGTFLAYAGLERLDLLQRATEVLDPNFFVPAVGQGALAVCIKSSRDDLRELLSPLNHKESLLCTQIERAFLKEIDGTCCTPVGVHATLGNQECITLNTFLGSTDGRKIVRHSASSKDGMSLARSVAIDLKSKFANL